MLNHPNAAAHSASRLHWHTTSTADGAAVETTHPDFFDALATGRRAAGEARPAQGRVRWHVEDANGRGPVVYFVHGANGALVAEIAVSAPCVHQHGSAADVA